MFVPLVDVNPLRYVRFQFVTIGLILANVAVFTVFQSGLFYQEGEAFTLALGIIPAVIVDVADLPPSLVLVPEDATFLTYMFLHGGWLHLASNMLFLWVFGDNVEDAMGHLRYLAFYLLCGVVAGLAHVAVTPLSEAPLVGASGAIAGILAAYLMLHPRVRLWVLAFARIPLRIPAWLVLGAWLAIQIANAFVPADMGEDMGPTNEAQIAWFAHLGGFAAGAVLVLFMRRPGVRLFDRGLPGPTSPLAPPTQR
jgi:membrane associated rhomboid family serine protease